MVGENWWSARPVAYHSKKFDPAQQNYSVHDQELLAVIEGLRRFENRLIGREVIVCCDNGSLSKFMTGKELPRGRASRWCSYLSQCVIHLEHIEGRHNVLADALSRQYDEDSAERAPEEYADVDKKFEEDFELNQVTLRSRKKAKPEDAASEPAIPVEARVDIDARSRPVRRRTARSRRTPSSVLRTTEQQRHGRKLNSQPLSLIKNIGKSFC